MPEDVRNFYLMTNGFHMTWSVKLDGKSASLILENSFLLEWLEEAMLKGLRIVIAFLLYCFCECQVSNPEAVIPRPSPTKANCCHQCFTNSHPV